jgi:hypothetical protein
MIRLERVRTSGTFYRATPSLLPPSPYPSRFQGRWRPFSDDSLTVFWTNGFWGLGVRLRAQGDSLVGYIFETHDVIGPRFPAAPLAAVRMACPADDKGP